MRKVLIISYFFPPSAKAGAHRAYSMAEYMPKYGWQPIFLAPQNGYYGRFPRYDEELLNEVEKFPVYRLPHFYPFNISSSNWLVRAARRLWETILVPDGKVLWNKAVKKNLGDIVSRHKPDVVFITATPFSSFLLAPFIKKEFGLPVVLDYRDPWASNPLIERNRFRAKLALSLERKTFEAADLVTTASYRMIPYIKNSFGSAAENKLFFGFPYGYDGDFFRKEILPIPLPPSSEETNAMFAGYVHGNIEVEMILAGIKLALEKKRNARSRLKVHCFGTLFGSAKKPEVFIDKYRLEKQVKVHPFLPYRQFLEELRRSSFLILPHGDSPIARVLFPTKFFDYLGVKRPILYIGGQGQVAESIRDCNAGVCVEPAPQAIAEGLINLVRRKNEESWYSEDFNYKKLDRLSIFSDFCSVLNELCERNEQSGSKKNG